MIYQLRDYQQECVQAIKDTYAIGIRNQLIVLPTGSGKSVVIAENARVIPGRTLVLDHREELTLQNGRKLVSLNPDAEVAIEQAGKFAYGHEEIIVGSVQTLSRDKCRRLIRLLRYGYFSKVIIDEAHHAAASSYQAILDCCREYNKELSVFGYTATPKRSDGIGLERIFQKVVYTKTLREMIELGYLVDIQPMKVATKTNLDGIHSKAGDFKDKELADRVNNSERNSLIVKGWMDHARGMKTIVFCVDVSHTQNVTDLFCRQGIPTEMVIGDTHSDIRPGIFRRFKEGKTQVLVNCNVTTEGFDEPGVECVLMARPTKSQLIYIQQLGRGMRPVCDLTGLDTPEERNAAIAQSSKPLLHLIDVVDNASSHSPIMLADLMGVPRKARFKNEGIVSVAKKIERALKQAPNLNVNKIGNIEKLQDLVTEALKVNIWTIEPPKEVKKNSSLSWTQVDDSYQLQLGKHETLLIKENALGQFEAILRSDATYDYDEQKWKAQAEHFEVMAAEPTLESMFKRCDKWVEENFEDQMILLKQSAKWKKNVASEKQVAFLLRMHFPVRKQNAEPQIYSPEAKGYIKLTRGLASMLIDKTINKNKRANA